MAKGTALLSTDSVYRYRLTRTFDDRDTEFRSGVINFVMLNPSTAVASIDDPTIRKCMNFTWSWGYRELIVTNLFALRATDPVGLYRHRPTDAIGPQNDTHLRAAADQAWVTVLAYGNHGGLYDRDRQVLDLLKGRPMMHLGLTESRKPKHPLYLKATTALEVMA